MSDMTDFYSAMGSKQRDQRVKRFYTDQHGRRFFAWADKDNQRPIGEFVLADRTGTFGAPKWTPPMAYIEWPDPDALDFKWTYEALASELAGMTSEWYSGAQQMAQLAHLPIPEIGGECDPKLIGLLGPPPLSPEIPLACAAGEPWLLGVIGAPVNTRMQTILNQGRSITSTYAMEVIRARITAMVEAQARGEPIEDLKDLSTIGVIQPVANGVLVAAPFVFNPDMSYNEFVELSIRGGASFSDAVKAWKTHRENMAELEAVG